jgi:hypothetical protein
MSGNPPGIEAVAKDHVLSTVEQVNDLLLAMQILTRVQDRLLQKADTQMVRMIPVSNLVIEISNLQVGVAG